MFGLLSAVQYDIITFNANIFFARNNEWIFFDVSNITYIVLPTTVPHT